MIASNYIAQVLTQVNAVTEACGSVLLYGENIDTGSRISGLARGLKVNSAGRILNVGNCELTHIGVGLGMMLDGGKAVVFMKQLDFLLLGLDQLVNTFNSIRTSRSIETLGSFTIFLIVCDQGYQGPQSSLNAASDFASLANIGVYCVNGVDDGATVIGNHFVRPGFRMICLSQRLFGAPVLELKSQCFSVDDAIFKYFEGNDITVLSFNFALRESVTVVERLAGFGLNADLFHVNYVPGLDLSMIEESCQRTGKLVLIDDSKAITKFGDAILADLITRGLDVKAVSIGRRGGTPQEYGVCEDRFVLNECAILKFAHEGRVSSRGSATCIVV